MSGSFFRERAGLYYDSDEIGEELDDFFRSGFLQSDEEDGDAYTANECDGSDSDGTDSPKAIIFIVEGLRKQIDCGLYAQIEVPRSNIIHIPLVAEQAITGANPYNGMMDQARNLLNIVLSHMASDDSDKSSVAIAFWASDLAVSIVKKVFWGTLQRAPAIRSWEAVLFDWTHAYCEERAMPNFRDLVGPLAAFQRRLSLEFDTMMRRHSMRTVNYYEMNSELEGDYICFTRFNAIFGDLGQARIATPYLNPAVRLYQDQIGFLERNIQDEIYRLKSDYLEVLELLALHCPISHMRPGHSMRFHNLAKYILTKLDVKKRSQGATNPSLTHSAWAESDKSRLVPRNIVLGLCVKSLLIGAHTVSVHIIIEQPEDPRVAASFLDLIYLIKRFIETTETIETTTKIVILSPATHQGVTVDDPTIAAPVCWDFDNIGISILNIDINPTSPDVRDVLIKDYTDVIADYSVCDDQSQIVKDDAELLALNNLTKLEVFRATVALAQKPSFYTFQPRESSPDLDKMSQNVVARILNLIPKSIEKVVWAGLHWLITAHRPLTCQEFAAVLQLEESDDATAIINYDQVTLPTSSVFEFISLFYGLVEVNKNRMCLSADTTKIATPGATEERDQTEQERSQIPTLLPYAIEHWFEFLQSDYCNGEGKAMMPVLMKDVEEFVADEATINRCLNVYKRKGNLTSFPGNITVPSLSRIQKRLSLSIKDTISLVLTPIKRHSPLALDSGWQYVALGVTESNNEAALLKADQCQIFDDEKILRVAFEIASDRLSCLLAKGHPDFVQKHSAKLISDAIRLDNSSFITHIVSQGDTFMKDIDVPEDGVTILCSTAEFKYMRYVRHIGEAHKDKRSPLHLAAISGHRFHEDAPTEALDDRDRQYGHSDIVEQLIAAGANMAICNKQKQSPLHIACQMGNSKIVAKLVAAGANPNGRDQLQKTPLNFALENRHTATAANLLLDCTMAIVQYQRSGNYGQNGRILPETPYEKLMAHFVTPSPDTTVVRMAKSRELAIASPFMTTRILVSKSSVSVSTTKSNHNINVNLKDNNMVEIDQPHGQEAIQYAAEYGHTEILELLLAALPIQKDIDNDWQISSPMHLACKRGHVRSIKYLIKYGFPRDNTDNLGHTALSVAVKSYQTSAVASFASYCTPTNRNTAFLEASKLNFFNIVEVLIQAKADMDSVDDSGSTALHYCSSNDNPKLMQLLISKGCNLNIVDGSHRTPVFMLIDAGADVDMHDARGFTPLYAAASGAHHRAVQMLLMAKCALSLAYRQTKNDLLEKSLTDFNANVFRHIPHKLLWFLEGEHYDIEKMIGECGSILNYAALRDRRIDINIIHPNKTYGAPLQLAAFRGNDDGPRIVEILLARDANIYKGSGFYGSALNEKTKVEAAYIQMAKLLISHEKTIINFSAGYHGAPIQFAIATGSPAMFQFLLTQEPILSHPTGACGTILHHAAYTSKSKALQALLSDEEFDILPGIEVDDEEVLPSRTSTTPRSDNGDTYNCDACSVVIYGPVHICQQCIDFKLCFKCHRRVALLHYQNHVFKKVT
ncbi:ankyrin repeat-containing domain protein [Trichoderma sp. SZMC 28015]